MFSPEPVELKRFKIYIKINLINCFMKSFKCSIRVFIFFCEKTGLKLFVIHRLLRFTKFDY